MTDTAPPRPIPATIGLFFGGLWAFLGAQGLRPAWQWPVIVAAVLITAFLIVRVWRMRSAAGGSRLFGRRDYFLAVAFEIVAIVIFTNLAPRYGWQDELVPVVGIIVGLHFTGLWRATMMTRFLWIAGGMVVISVLSALLPHAWNAIDPRDAVCGLGNALVLWFGAAQRPKMLGVAPL